MQRTLIMVITRTGVKQWLHDSIMLLVFKQMHLGIPAKRGEFHQSGGEKKGEFFSTTSRPQSSVCHDLCNETER